MSDVFLDGRAASPLNPPDPGGAARPVSEPKVLRAFFRNEENR